jgi:hypothetical protein
MKNKIDPFLATRKECNPSDGRCYKVSTKYNKNTHQEASLLLAALNKFSVNFMKHLRNKFLWERNGTPAQQDIVLFLLNNYNPDSIIENAPDSDINTSYVEDKGKVFAICLREKESGENKFIPIHELEFVVIHEMTHLGTRTIGHGKEFWRNFKFLLQEANDMGIHIPTNYKNKPVRYCSLLVNYSPFFDSSLSDP